MAVYDFGKANGTGSEIVVSESELLLHTLVVGGRGSGKSSFLTHLASEQALMRRPLAIFDADGNLFWQTLSHYVETKREDTLLLDATLTDWIMGFDPLRQETLPPEVRVQRVSEVTLEVGRRMGLDLDYYERNDPLGGISEIIRRGVPTQGYYHRSLGIGFLHNLDFVSMFQEGKSFLSLIPAADDSLYYGMLLFDAFLAAAETVPAREATTLVFIDDVFRFACRTLAEAMPRLTDQGIGLVAAASFQQLGALKRMSPKLYDRLLNGMKTIVAFDGSEGDPLDVIIDVRRKLFPPEELH